MSSDKVLYVNPETKDVIANGNVVVNGNIGIGTTQPLAKLHVNGSLMQSDRFMAMYTYTSSANATLVTSAVLGFPMSLLTLDSAVSQLNGLNPSSLYDSNVKGFIAPYAGLYNFAFSLNFTASISNCISGLAPYNCLGFTGIPANVGYAFINGCSTGELNSCVGSVILAAGNTIIPMIYGGTALTLRGSGGNNRLIITLSQRFV